MLLTLAFVVLAINCVHLISLELRVQKLEREVGEAAQDLAQLHGDFGRLRSVWWEGVRSKYPVDPDFDAPWHLGEVERDV